jgi:hypothetical protein
MIPALDTGGLKKTRPWEYVVRFVFGGIITALAGLAAHAWGPIIGGLFLAFPAILPASLTLVGQHDGRQQALEDARGGLLGSMGLIGFAVVVWTAARAWPPAVVLLVATLAWLAVDGLLWALRHGREGA